MAHYSINNYLNFNAAPQNGKQWSGRIDHQFSQKDSFFARYSHAFNVRENVFWDTRHEEFTGGSVQVAISNTHTFSPTTLLTTRFGMSRPDLQIIFRQTPDMVDLPKRLGSEGSFPGLQGTTLAPQLGAVDYIGLWAGNPQNLFGPQLDTNWTADLHKTQGAHTFEFGGGFNWTSFKQGRAPGYSGGVNYAHAQTSNFNTTTGVGLASLLLGLPISANLDGSAFTHMTGNGYSLYAQDSFRVTPKLTLNLGLRWEYAAPLTDKIGMGTFIFSTGQNVWDSKNPITGAPANARRGLVEPDKNNFQPRLGMAYQVNGKTVVRAGYSVFFDSYGANRGQTAQGTRGQWPYSAANASVSDLNAVFPTTIYPLPNVQLFPVTAGTVSQVPLSIGSAFNLEKATSRTPYVQQWTVSLQRQLTQTMMTEAVYFGSHGLKGVGTITDNTAWPPALGPVRPRRPFPQFGSFSTNGYNAFPSYYNGLSVKVQKRMGNNLSFLASYTWAKNINYMDSTVSDGILGQGWANPTRYDWRRFKGPAGFDIGQRFVASYVYQVPVKTGSKALDAVVANWTMTGVLQFDNGTPFSVYAQSDVQNIGGGSQFANLVGDPNAIAERRPEQWFNKAAFATPALGTIGNAGRGILRGDGLAQFDAALLKRWPFGERKWVEFRAEALNLTNKVNFRIPNSFVDSVQFGRVSGERSVGGIAPARVIQLGMKLRF